MKFSLVLLLSITILTIVLGNDLLQMRLPKFTVIKDKAITDRYEKIAYEWYKKEAAREEEKIPQDIEVKYHSTARGFLSHFRNKVIRVMFKITHKKPMKHENNLAAYHRPDYAALIMFENGTVLGRWEVGSTKIVFWNQVPDEAEADRYLKLALDAYKRETKTKNLEHKVVEITEIYVGKDRDIKVVIEVTDKDSMKKQQAGFMLFSNGTVVEHMIPMEYKNIKI